MIYCIFFASHEFFSDLIYSFLRLYCTCLATWNKIVTTLLLYFFWLTHMYTSWYVFGPQMQWGIMIYVEKMRNDLGQVEKRPECGLRWRGGTWTKRDIGYKDEEDQDDEDEEGHGLQGWGRPRWWRRRGTWATRMRKTGITRTKRDMGYKDEEDQDDEDKEGHGLQGWGRPGSRGRRGTKATRMMNTRTRKTKRDMGYKDEEDQDDEDRGAWATRMRKTGITRTKRDMGYKVDEYQNQEDKEGQRLQGWGRSGSQGQRVTWATRTIETSSVSVNCNICTIYLYHT